MEDVFVYVIQRDRDGMFHKGSDKWVKELARAKKYKRKCDAGNAIDLHCKKYDRIKRLKEFVVACTVKTYKLVEV